MQKTMKNKMKTAHQEIIESGEDIIKGANQTDQLEKLQPQSEEEKNTREQQAGMPPITDVNDGERSKDDE